MAEVSDKAARLRMRDSVIADFANEKAFALFGGAIGPHRTSKSTAVWVTTGDLRLLMLYNKGPDMKFTVRLRHVGSAAVRHFAKHAQRSPQPLAPLQSVGKSNRTR